MNETQWGNFALFGFTKKATKLKHQLLAFGITPKFIDFGTEGHLFLYSSYGDEAESEQAIGLKLGFIRSKTYSPLSVQQLLQQKVLQPDNINHDAIRGNGLLGCFSKSKPEFCVYQTILAPIPLYCITSDWEIICATDIRCLLNFLEHVEINQKTIPMHFLFGFSIGSSTYFHNIWRLMPGQMLKWSNESCRTRLVQNLNSPDNALRFERLDRVSVDRFYEGMGAVMQAYREELTNSKITSANLLSGGVDSSVIQLLINEQFPQTNKPSFSYAVDTRDFEFEIEYARYASQLLQTHHTFVPVTPPEIPDLLWKTVEILGQPNLYVEAVPCHLALIEFLTQNEPSYRYFFIGQGADGLHGVSEQKKMAILDAARQIPGSDLLLKLMISLLSPWAKNKAHGLQEVANMLDRTRNPASALPAIYSPTNYVALFGGGTIAYRCFGDQIVEETLNYREELATTYYNGPELMEKIQIVDLLTASYEPAVAMNQLYLAKRKEGIFFYLDEDIIRMAFAINPKFRFLRGLTTTKPMLKKILTSSSFSVLATKKKGGSVFHQDLFRWMKQGPLQEIVHSIERPSFIDKSLFNEVLNNPGPFLWLLLTFDIFTKQLKNR